MKRVVLFFIAVFLLTGCKKEYLEVNIPIYETLEVWRSKQISMEAPRPLRNPGKIYIYKNLLLVNEFMKGLHIFDNSQPSNPINLGFLPVYANVDMAVKDDILYVDSYTDMLSFDISNPQNPQFTHRLIDAFVYSDYENFFYVDTLKTSLPISNIEPFKGIVVGWETGIVHESDGLGLYKGVINNHPLQNFSGGTTNVFTNNQINVGTPSSTSKFAIEGNFLYTLSGWRVSKFNISSEIIHIGGVNLTNSSSPRNLFSANHKLFICATNGVDVYDLSNPSSPTYISSFNYVTGYDHMIVQNNTIFASSSINNGLNLLYVIDISNLSAPRLMVSYSMTDPKGLCVINNTLLLCDGPDGLKIFDKTDLSAIDVNMTAQFPGIISNDVIPLQNSLLMTGLGGIYQYDYSDLRNITEISVISIQ